MNFKNAKHLRLHLFYFHRHEDHTYLQQHGYDKEEIADIPPSYSPGIITYKKAREQIVNHWAQNEDRLYSMLFLEIANSDLEQQCNIIEFEEAQDILKK